MSIRERIFWSLGLDSSARSALFIFAILPTITVVALVESKLGIVIFFKSVLQEFLGYTRSLWSAVFEFFEFGFRVTVFQADLLTLFVVSLFAAFAELLLYRTDLARLTDFSSKQNDWIDLFIRFVPLTFIYLVIVIPNILIKMSFLEGFVTVFTITIQGISVLTMLWIASIFYSKGLKKPGFFNRWFFLFGFLYYTLQIAFVPADYSVRYNEALEEGSAVESLIFLQFYATAAFTCMFVILYLLAWRLFLRVMLLIFAFVFSDWIVALVAPVWTGFVSFLEEFRDSGELPGTLE